MNTVSNVPNTDIDFFSCTLDYGNGGTAPTSFTWTGIDALTIDTDVCIYTHSLTHSGDNEAMTISRYN